jgi:hypothetical protein
MTTIANCFSHMEALRLQMLLASVDIPSFIPDENVSTIAPYLFFTSSGVRLQVADEHTTAARQIIANASLPQ